MTRSQVHVNDLVDALHLIAYAGRPDEFADRITFIP